MKENERIRTRLQADMEKFFGGGGEITEIPRGVGEQSRTKTDSNGRPMYVKGETNHFNRPKGPAK